MGPVNLNTQPLAWSLWGERVIWDPMAAQVSPEPTPGTIERDLCFWLPGCPGVSESVLSGDRTGAFLSLPEPLH